MLRREFLAISAALAGGAAAQPPGSVARRGRIRQAAMLRNFPPAMPFDEMCREAARLGCKGFDTIPAANWPVLRQHGLIPTLALSTATPLPFVEGIIHKNLHDRMERAIRADIDQCASGGCPTVGVAGGQRRGMSYEECADNSVGFFNRVKGPAEERGVNIVIEVMSRFDRPDQACDHVAWAVDVCRRVNSPRVKVLFDIYHIQVMDGDICRNIRDNIQWIGHIHAGGVPGRHEIDDSQELNYRFIAKTIADAGFTGYVAHEWTPSPGRDALRSLAEAVDIMDA